MSCKRSGNAVEPVPNDGLQIPLYGGAGRSFSWAHILLLSLLTTPIKWEPNCTAPLVNGLAGLTADMWRGCTYTARTVLIELHFWIQYVSGVKSDCNQIECIHFVYLLWRNCHQNSRPTINDKTNSGQQIPENIRASNCTAIEIKLQTTRQLYQCTQKIYNKYCAHTLPVLKLRRRSLGGPMGGTHPTQILVYLIRHFDHFKHLFNKKKIV